MYLAYKNVTDIY